MQIKCDDQLGSRGLKKVNVLIVPGQGLLKFTGESISPVAKVLLAEPSKNGKWSCTTWTIELAEGVRQEVIKQDWESSEWLLGETLGIALEDLKKRLKITPEDGITDPQILQFLQAHFPKSLKKLQDKDSSWGEGKDQVAELLAAQKALAEAKAAEQEVLEVVYKLEEAEKMMAEAAAIQGRVTAAKALLGKGKVSLSDLKSAMGL